MPPISNLVALEYVLHELQLFPSGEERRNAIQTLKEAGFGGTDEMSSRLQIGIKKLLSIIEMARHEPDNVVQRLTGALMGLGM